MLLMKHSPFRCIELTHCANSVHPLQIAYPGTLKLTINVIVQYFKMLNNVISRACNIFHVVTPPANKSFSLSFVRPLRAKVKMFCQDVVLKKSIVESVYFFGSLDRLFLRAKFAYQMRRKCLSMCVCAIQRARVQFHSVR